MSQANLPTPARKYATIAAIKSARQSKITAQSIIFSLDSCK